MFSTSKLHNKKFCTPNFQLSFCSASEQGCVTIFRDVSRKFRQRGAHYKLLPPHKKIPLLVDLVFFCQKYMKKGGVNCTLIVHHCLLECRKSLLYEKRSVSLCYGFAPEAFLILEDFSPVLRTLQTEKHVSLCSFLLIMLIDFKMSSKVCCISSWPNTLLSPEPADQLPNCVLCSLQ